MADEEASTVSSDSSEETLSDDSSLEEAKADNENVDFRLHQTCAKSSTTLKDIRHILQEAPYLLCVEDKDGLLPIHEACRSGVSIHVVKHLLNAWPGSAKWRTRNGSTPLQIACSNQPTIEIVRFLVENEPQALRLVNNNGWSPLHAACAYGATLDIIQFLVQKYPQACSKATFAHGDLPLHLACFGNANLPVFKCLVGTDENTAKQLNHQAESPVEKAKLSNATQEIIDFLEKIKTRPPSPKTETSALLSTADERKEKGLRSDNTEGKDTTVTAVIGGQTIVAQSLASAPTLQLKSRQILEHQQERDPSSGSEGDKIVPSNHHYKDQALSLQQLQTAGHRAYIEPVASQQNDQLPSNLHDNDQDPKTEDARSAHRAVGAFAMAGIDSVDDDHDTPTINPTQPGSDAGEEPPLPSDDSPPLFHPHVLEATPVNDIVYASVEVEEGQNVEETGSNGSQQKSYWRYILVGVIAGLAGAVTSVVMTRSSPATSPASATKPIPVPERTFAPSVRPSTKPTPSLAPTGSQFPSFSPTRTATPTTSCPTTRCGHSWWDANSNCGEPCGPDTPLGWDCTDPDETCFSSLERWGCGCPTTAPGPVDPEPGSCTTFRCGLSKMDANMYCRKPCARWPDEGWDNCPNGETCYANLINDHCCGGSEFPSLSPSTPPTVMPTFTGRPTSPPSLSPTSRPTRTSRPTFAPSLSPTSRPTITSKPTIPPPPCGEGNVGNGICEDGRCCPPFGWCGCTSDHCINGQVCPAVDNDTNNE